jgi:hypothetical protein
MNGQAGRHGLFCAELYAIGSRTRSRDLLYRDADRSPTINSTAYEVARGSILGGLVALTFSPKIPVRPVAFQFDISGDNAIS